jgi:hypothetical protein
MRHMEPFQLLTRRTLWNTVTVTGVFALLWALSPTHKSIFAGLTIGSAVSLYFVVSQIRQVEMVADIALKKARKRPSIMMANRLAVLLGAFLLAKALEPKIGYVSFPGMVIGFYVYQFVLLGGFLYNKIKRLSFRYWKG